MTTPNFVYDSTVLNLPTADRYPVTDPTRQWGAVDVAQVAAALNDIRTVIRASLDVKQFGAVGDGVADDAPAIQAALNAAAVVSGAVYGSIVSMPRGLYLCGSQISIPNGVGLCGAGPTATLIKASNTFSAASLIRNTTQNGTQEFAFLESLSVLGNKGGGALCTTAVVDFVSLFLNSYVRDVVIQDGSNVGLRIGAAGSPGGAGPMLIENVWCLNNTGGGFLGEEIAGNAGAAVGICCINLASEHQGPGRSAIYLKGLGGASQWNFYNTHIEQGGTDAGRTCITLDGISRVMFDGVQLMWGGSAGQTGIAITNVAQNVEIQIRGVLNLNLINPILSDAKNGVTYGSGNVPWYVTPEVTAPPALNFLPIGSGNSAVFQSAAGVAKAWFTSLGQITGASPNLAGLDVVGAALGPAGDDRVMAFVNHASTNVYGLLFPNAGGGVLDLNHLTSGANILRFGTDGSFRHMSSKGGFFGASAVVKPTVTGSRGGNAALASALTALAGLGLVTDSTTA